MTYEVEVKEVPEQRVAAVHVHTSFDRIGEEVQHAFMTLGQTVGAPIGMPFLVAEDVDEAHEVGDFEVCFPVSGDVPPSRAVEEMQMPGGRVASTIHRGLYREIGPAYAALETWIGQHGEHHAGPPRELYLNDPGEAGEEAALTEVQMPIR